MTFKASKITSRLALCGIISAMMIGLSACGNKVTEGILTECVLPTDQSGSLSGEWPKLPIPVAFRQGDFTSGQSAQVDAVLNAADTWNQFYRGSKGYSLIDYKNSGSIAVSNQANLTRNEVCNLQIFDSSDNYANRIVIYKHSSGWPHGGGIIALTTYCPYPSRTRTLPSIEKAIIEINAQNFDFDGSSGGSKKSPDLESIMLHEFGHLVGLKHSCEFQQVNGIPVCSTSMNSDYFFAVMYAEIRFPGGKTGEQRRSLQANDQGRANCLYQQ